MTNNNNNMTLTMLTRKSAHNIIVIKTNLSKKTLKPDDLLFSGH